MSNTDAKKIMAENIRRYMEKKGVTNQQLCDALNFKYTTFMDWIKGATYPRIGKVEAMANYFGCEKSDLIEDKTKRPIEDDGLTESQRKLIAFALTVPEGKADLVLSIMKTIVESD